MAFGIGWNRLPIQNAENEVNKTVSILIPARNEAQNIERILQAVVQQDFPKNLLKIIVADDHSEDETAAIVKNFIQKHPNLNLELHFCSGQGKKSALSELVQKADSEIIITTDADCVPTSNQWIKSIVSNFTDKTQLVSAPVVYFWRKGRFQKMQSLEFLTLITSAAGAIGIKMPFMCNGANIAFRKTAFTETHGFENDKFVSGDDVFLLERVLQHFGSETIRFAKSKNAIVETEPMPNLKRFFEQRIRWAGKSVGYKNPISIITSYVVFLNAFSIITSFVLGFYNPMFFYLTICFFLLKIMVDFPICTMITNFSNRKYLMAIFLPLQIVYPIYVCSVAIMSLFVKTTWKGRTVKKINFDN